MEEVDVTTIKRPVIRLTAIASVLLGATSAWAGKSETFTAQAPLKASYEAAIATVTEMEYKVTQSDPVSGLINGRKRQGLLNDEDGQAFVIAIQVRSVASAPANAPQTEMVVNAKCEGSLDFGISGKKIKQFKELFAKHLESRTQAAEVAGAPKTVALGQAPEEVESIIGKPEKVVDLGAKKIWVYSDMKVVFVDQKVSDVQ